MWQISGIARMDYIEQPRFLGLYFLPNERRNRWSPTCGKHLRTKCRTWPHQGRNHCQHKSKDSEVLHVPVHHSPGQCLDNGRGQLWLFNHQPKHIKNLTDMSDDAFKMDLDKFLHTASNKPSLLTITWCTEGMPPTQSIACCTNIQKRVRQTPSPITFSSYEIHLHCLL